MCMRLSIIVLYYKCVDLIISELYVFGWLIIQNLTCDQCYTNNKFVFDSYDVFTCICVDSFNDTQKILWTSPSVNESTLII